MSDTDTHSYIGRAPCGCVRAATVDLASDPKGVARDVADFIKDGLTIERVPHQYVRDNLWRCPHQIIPDDQMKLELGD